MAEQLSALDTMFLDLEEADDGATMHFGAVLVFDRPRGGRAGHRPRAQARGGAPP